MEERTSYILKILLKHNDYITYQQILDELNEEYDYDCNIKSIKPSIDAINTFFEIVFGINDAIESIKKKGTKINHTIINSGEMRFLHDTLVHNTSISYEDGYKLYTKLMNLLPESERIEKDEIEGTSGNLMLIFLNTIIKAINNKNAIKFKYINYTYDQTGNMIEQYAKGGINGIDYVISPYRIFMNQGKYYVIGYAPNHSDQARIYRLDRMREVRNNKKNYYEDKTDEWDIDDQIKHNVNMFTSDNEIELELYAHTNVLRPIVDQFGTKLKVMPSQDKDYLNITIDHVYESDGLIGWLMMMSPKIKVVKPESVIHQIKQRLEQTMNLYK